MIVYSNVVYPLNFDEGIEGTNKNIFGYKITMTTNMTSKNIYIK